MPATYSSRQWIYRRRPQGGVGNEHYELETATWSGELARGEALIEAVYLSVDPYMRIQQAARDTWAAPHPLDVVQGGAVVARVLALGAPLDTADAVREGDFVLTYTGWQERTRCAVAELTRLDPSVPPSTALGALGMPGRTAWFGLMEAGKPRPGDTLVVSAAAGAVGSLVVQFGVRAGCRVIGIAGGADKCRFVQDELGAAAAIDYKRYPDAAALAQAIAEASGGVDIYFDNVGGMVSDAVIPLFKLRARGVICGQISQYDGGLDAPALGPRVLQHLLFQRASLQGVLARDFTHRMAEYLPVATPWVRAGELIARETIIDGFERLPEALATNLRGGTIGKAIVRVTS